MALETTPEQLERLLAIGADMAEKITEYRDEIEGDLFEPDLSAIIERFDAICAEIEGKQSTIGSIS